MDWLMENWSLVAFIIAMVFIVIIFLLRTLGGAKGNALADELEKWKGIAADRDAVLKQTFENVEALKDEWKGITRIGQIFKKRNEDVSMEEVVRENYIRHLGDKVGLKPKDDDETKTG